MPVTIKDIARKIGKSTTTVSRALHDYDDISPETKQLVRKVATEMGYIPNTLAQRLQKQHTDTLALILPTYGPRFSDPFFSEFIAGLGNQAARLGYDLLVSTTPPGEDELQAYQFNVQGRRVDGFVVVRTRCQDARIDYLRRVDFPFVAYGSIDGEMDFPLVDVDSRYGMNLVVNYLLDLGHRRLACITPPMDLMFARHRLYGVRASLESRGILCAEDLIVASDLTQAGGYQKTLALLDIPNPPTAIIACNDLMALGAMSAVQERGLHVGANISITGFDDIVLAEHSHPSLTTVHQPIEQIGEMVCDMLVKIVHKEPLEEKQIILKPDLVVRQSCGRVTN
jgi:LacI family transcriptional regulator